MKTDEGEQPPAAEGVDMDELARADVRRCMERAADTLNRLATDPAYLTEIERRDSDMTGPDPIRRMANHLDDPANLAWHHKERWAQRMAELRWAMRDAPDEDARARAKQAMRDHYAREFDVEVTRAEMMAAVTKRVADRPSGEEANASPALS